MFDTLVLRAVVVCATLCAVASANAADLAGHRAGMCLGHGQSLLSSQPREVIEQTVWSNLESARAGMVDPHVIASQRSALTWAMQSRWACATAAGYLQGGTIDEESVGKCDCFHQRYLSLR